MKTLIITALALSLTGCAGSFPLFSSSITMQHPRSLQTVVCDDVLHAGAEIRRCVSAYEDAGFQRMTR